MSWHELGGVRATLLILAVLGVGYLLLQSRPAETRLSNWRGVAGASAAPLGAGGISGEALPHGGLNPDAVGDQDMPTGNPLRTPRTVMTQGYGVGSHAPAEIWGGVDLAIDGDGDGQADPQGTQDAPVYATHGGRVETHADTWPGGNCVLLHASGYRTTYCHLSRFAVADGAQVRRGDLIAYVGSTGNSSGPHLHYEVWVGGVNHSPLDFGVLDGIRR
ncbi:MAG TPA: M23 family metallopeptidase [Roseiflexaceae bacterium]|nr:M23 family metallopeptidase [Roseiflexaceae bacterium]